MDHSRAAKYIVLTARILFLDLIADRVRTRCGSPMVSTLEDKAMKTKSFRILMSVLLLGAFSGVSVAAPDFHMLEQGRLAKKAEAQKAQAGAKKCLNDSVKGQEADR